MARRTLRELYRDEFRHYTAHRFRQDLFAGLTVAAVALPLALAFGVASGATAGAGLVTAIVAGIVIGGLSGAPYQISGPTGAMTAVLLVLAHKYGLSGVWVAGAMSGVCLLAIGALGLGRFIAFIPAPVIAGFTSGIALIIAIGQIDNLLGVRTPGADSAAGKLLGYLSGGYAPDWHAAALGAFVAGLMLTWPRRWGARFPASLLGIVLGTLGSVLLRWPVSTIGNIPHTLLLENRLTLANFPWSHLQDFIFPTLSITALGAVESLLCGAVASNMTGIRLAANAELMAQGVGNIVIPFLGGVPATAAIARTSVGIRSGGQTRLVSIVHALALMLSMFVAAPVMSRIPLAALAGVLLVTAWRMNEWESIQFIFGRRFKTAMLTFLATMLATVVLDLTQAILAGALISAAVFLNQIASIQISVEDVDPGKLRQRGLEVEGDCHGVRVAYVNGPLFFAATGLFNETFAHVEGRVLVLAMRGMPLIDTSGLQALAALHERLRARGVHLLLAAVHPPVLRMLERSGLVAAVGPDHIYSSADEAIVMASRIAQPYPERGSVEPVRPAH